jgi:nicotinamide-nucleotide amidase
MPSDSPCVAPELIAEASNLGRTLLAKKLTVVTAESCTAGLLAATLAQVKGASDFLHGAFVTYTKDQKTLAVGVSPQLLKTCGSVNDAVAVALAEGALERSKADLGIGITGVLGPSPDEDGNPVGLVYIACAPRGGPTRCEKHEYGERHHEWIRRQVIRDACELVLDTIEKS